MLVAAVNRPSQFPFIPTHSIHLSIPEPKFVDGYTLFEWNDTQTNAIGWIVIDHPTPTLAGGGLFMHENATLSEVVAVARTMTFKLSLSSHPWIKGAKGGIRFSHQNPNSHQVLERFIRDNAEIIKKYWATGGDFNTSHGEIQEYLEKYCNITSALTPFARELSSPCSLKDIEAFCAEPIDNIWRLDEASVGFGMAVTLAKLLAKIGTSKVNISIQGFGTVGRTFAHFLNKFHIGKIVAIAAEDGLLLDENGINLLNLFHQPLDTKLLWPLLDFDYAKSHFIQRHELSEPFLAQIFKSHKCDVFAPCAGRGEFNKDMIHLLSTQTFKESNVRLLIAGANNIFPDSINYSQILTDNQILMVPEYVSNSGTSNLFVSVCSKDIRKWSTTDAFETIRQNISSFLDSALANIPLKADRMIEACNKLAQSRKRVLNLFGIKGVYGVISHTRNETRAKTLYNDIGVSGDSLNFNNSISYLAGGQSIQFIPTKDYASEGLEIIFSVESLAQLVCELDSRQIEYTRDKDQDQDQIMLSFTIGGYNMSFRQDDIPYGPNITHPSSAYSIFGIDHYTMIVDDAYKVAQFHEKFLGFVFLKEIRLNVGSVPAGQYDMLNLVMGFPHDSRRSIVITQGLTQDSIFSRLHNAKTHDYVHHIAYEVDNIETAFQQVHQMGYETTSNGISTDMISGLKQFFIREELAGHFIEMIEREPEGNANFQGQFRDGNMISLAQSMKSYVVG